MDIKIPLVTQPFSAAALKYSPSVKSVEEVAPVTPVHPQNLSAAESQQQMLNQVLRQLLAHQLPPTQLLTQLSQDFPVIQHNAQLPTDLKSLLQLLVQTLPPLSNLNNPQLLAQALNNNGLFLEAKLAQALNGTEPQLHADFKANLLLLKAALQQQLLPETAGHLSLDELTSLKALQEKVTGALNTLVVDQLASLPKEDSLKQVWFMEVPFSMPYGTDSLKLEVERDAPRSNGNEQAPCWSVTLTLTPPGLSTLYCKVSFVDGALNTYFRSEDTQTLEMINLNLEKLRAQFEGVGLKLGYIDAQEGQLEKNIAHKLPQQAIFDDRA